MMHSLFCLVYLKLKEWHFAGLIGKTMRSSIFVVSFYSQD